MICLSCEKEATRVADCSTETSMIAILDSDERAAAFSLVVDVELVRVHGDSDAHPVHEMDDALHRCLRLRDELEVARNERA